MTEGQILTQEQVLEQLKTRGFEEGFAATPLRKFWGKLESYTGIMRGGNFGDFLVVQYNFAEVEPLESTEPYTAPIAQIEIRHSDRAKSASGYFGDSVDKIINVGVALDIPQGQCKNQDYLIGKMCLMEFTPGHAISSKDDATGQWKDKPTNCWTLQEVKGEGTSPAVAGAVTPAVAAPTGESAIQVALRLLDGKTEARWHQAVFIDPTVKPDTALVNSIISREFLPPYIASGVVTKDEEEVYHVNLHDTVSEELPF